MSEIKSQSKSARGGKRAGAGRKPTTIKGLAKKLGKFDAELILAKIKGSQKWTQLAKSTDENVSLKAMIYLTDRAYGKAAQPLEHSGSLDSNLIVRTDGDLAYMAEHGCWPEESNA